MLTFQLPWIKKKKKLSLLSFSALAKADAYANFFHIEMSDEIPVPSNETFIPPPAHYDSNKHVISSWKWWQTGDWRIW